ncbi:hypothetical protein N7532_007311 [Penicillium argentinense]|uniref:Uncharacterized protein n=1 Tax=Penicillium argentinense TaxID=1131581 RepID=A0A9W9F7P3_9EURO|nr:uncharacterized protein N7532_007311 [Penicillium argentinense]KAJ5095020.1 hypothetical protein N7532_007311 [Penicillium argentinense]
MNRNNTILDFGPQGGASQPGHAEGQNRATSFPDTELHYDYPPVKPIAGPILPPVSPEDPRGPRPNAQAGHPRFETSASSTQPSQPQGLTMSQHTRPKYSEYLVYPDWTEYPEQPRYLEQPLRPLQPVGQPAVASNNRNSRPRPHPRNWDEAEWEDHLLFQLRDQGLSWTQVGNIWRERTGYAHSDATMRSRVARIRARIGPPPSPPRAIQGLVFLTLTKGYKNGTESHLTAETQEPFLWAIDHSLLLLHESLAKGFFPALSEGIGS